MTAMKEIFRGLKGRYLFASMVFFAARLVVAQDIVDLGGNTVQKTAAEFKADYDGKILQNGNVELTGISASAGKRTLAGTYTIGNGATVVPTGCNMALNGNVNLNVVDGGMINLGDKYFGLSYRDGNSSLMLDGGTIVSDSTLNDQNAMAFNIGFVWNNKDVSGSDISTKAVFDNGSVLKLTKGNLRISGAKSTEQKVKTSKTDLAVTNSQIKVEQGTIYIGTNTDSKWLNDHANSYCRVVFGSGADITCKQIYAYKSLTPEVTFDGATIHWVEGGASFIGQNSAVNGDIYTLGPLGLAIDIPSGKAIAIDGNSSALKGEGGITKIGEGSLTWNNLTSSGSKKHLFTGPLVVSNGTWTSSLSYSASAFRADGGTLVLNGQLLAGEIELAATGGGKLTLAGATLGDAAPDVSLAGGGSTDYFICEDSVETRTVSKLSLGENAILDLVGDARGVSQIAAEEIELSASAENPVVINFSEPEKIIGGEYKILTGAVDFSADDLTKFKLDETLPKGFALSANGKSLVLSVPTDNPATWTGKAGDGNFSNKENWLGNEVPGVDSDVVISVTSDTTFQCPDAFAVNSMLFPGVSAKVTIEGAGSIKIAKSISNGSEARHVFKVPVAFVASDADAPIDVAGEIDFQGGVTGTVPVNHSTFYGNYVLSAESWTVALAIALAENASVTAAAMTLTLDGNRLLSAASGSKLSLSQIKYTKQGDMFGEYKGELTVATLYLMTTNSDKTSTVNDAFEGVMRVGAIRAYVKSDYWCWSPDGVVIVGGNGFSSAGGGLYFGKGGENLVLRSSADWGIINDYQNSLHTGYFNFGYPINAQSLNIDTSNYEDRQQGHTVTVSLGKTKDNQTERTLLDGKNGPAAVSAFGAGTFFIKDACFFTGGFTASNGVTVAVNKGAYPGKGNVTIKDTATLDLVQSASGPVPVAGTLTMQGGATLRIPEYSAKALPISVNALEFDGVTEDKKIALKIEGGSLGCGYNAILKSESVIPANAWENFAVTLGAAVPDGKEPLYTVIGNTLYIVVKGENDVLWTGAGATANFSDDGNWMGGAKPSNGANLYIAAAADTTIVNDIEGFSPASIAFSSDSAAVTIEGGCAISEVAAITNLSSVSHTINVPVYFKEGIAVVQNARGYKTRTESHIVFAGGAYANDGYTIASWNDGYSWAVFGNYFYANGAESPYVVKDYKKNETDDIRFVVCENSSLYIPYAGDLREIDIRPGSSVNIGEMKISSSGDRITHRNLCEVTVTNLFITGSGDRYLTCDQVLDASKNETSVFKFMSVTNDLKTNWFYLADKNKPTSHVIYIGEYGINFTDQATGRYCIGTTGSGNTETIRPWYSDFSIGTSARDVLLTMHRNVIFCTDDEGGEGRTITFDAIMNARTTPVITISGSGTLQVNKEASNNEQPTVSVVDTATLAYRSGASLGTGTTTVNAGATLKVADSGTVALGGDLTLKSGACLGFNFTNRNTPVLDLTTKNVAFAAEEGETMNVIVKITAEDGVLAKGGENILTSGCDFSKVNVSLADGAPDWVKGLYLKEDGSLAIEAKAFGTIIFLK